MLEDAAGIRCVAPACGKAELCKDVDGRTMFQIKTISNH